MAIIRLITDHIGGRERCSSLSSVAICIAMFVLAICPVMADHLGSAQAALAALRADLANGRVVRVEILAAPYGIATPIPISPDLLRGYATQDNGIFNLDLTPQLADDLIRAIDETKLQEGASGANLRWGATFFDQAGTALHTIYLNSCYFGGAGRLGYIDGSRVQLNRSLIAWFERTFPNRDWPCADGPPARRRLR